MTSSKFRRGADGIKPYKTNKPRPGIRDTGREECPDGMSFIVSGNCLAEGTCDCEPTAFVWNSSTEMAFWFFRSENVTLEGEPLSPDDWIGSFSPRNVCVGSRMWDTSQCGGGNCDIPVLGELASASSTDDYMLPGEHPTFKMWQASTNTVFNTIVSHSFPWNSFTSAPFDHGVSFGDFYIDGTTDFTIDYDLEPGQNLISIPLDLQDASLSSVFGNDVIGVIGEGVAASNTGTQWVGSLQNIDSLSGYWVYANQVTSLSVSGTPLGNPTYDLHSGANLISFPGMSSVPIEVALQGYEDVIIGIIGEGQAASNFDGNWVGSLSEFKVGYGYWVKFNQATTFQYNLMSTSSTSQNYIPMDIMLPRDLSNANINDVFDDIRNQVESQMGGVNAIHKNEKFRRRKN